MKPTLFLTLLTLLAVSASAQTLHFPMEVKNGQIAEQISGKTYTVSGRRDAIATQGAVGSALRTDGYSTYVEADIDASRLDGDAFTVALWLAAETYPMMNLDEDRNDYTTIAGTLDHTAKSGFALQITNRGNWRFECYAASGSEFALEAPALLPKRQWCHLAATVDASARQLTLYLNGEQVAQTTMRRGLNLGSSTLLIGKSREDVSRHGFLLNTFNGIIDDLTIYNRVLTAQETAAIAQESDKAYGTPADVSTPASAFANDLLRPRFHGMPSAGWTNETHGLTFYDGQWHAFFQKNGNGPYMSRLHWGHIVSQNLFDWQEMPIAIDPAERYDIKGCWSGCIATDEEVFGSPHPTIIYTGVDYAKASINVATATDASLIDWQKAGNNPRIAQRPTGLSDDFRDPYFFRTDQGAFLIVGSSKNGVGCCTLHKYDKATGTWSNDGQTFFEGTSAQQCGTFWEMPNVTRIDQDRWLFTVTPQNIGNGIGVRTLYWVGSIDANGKFTPSKKQSWPLTVEMSGMSYDGYGMLSPSIAQYNGQIIALGIVPDKVATASNLDWGWAHCYSLPRQWDITDDDLLIQHPYEGLSAMRATEDNYSRENFTLDGVEPIEGVAGRRVEVLATWESGTTDFGIELLRSADGRSLRITYAPSTGTITVDASQLRREVNDAASFKGIYRHTLAQRPAPGSDVTLHAYFDGSILDLFVNEREAASIRIFATDAESTGITLWADAPTSVRSAYAWELASQQQTSGIDETSTANQATSYPTARFEIDADSHQLKLFHTLPNGHRTRIL